MAGGNLPHTMTPTGMLGGEVFGGVAVEVLLLVVSVGFCVASLVMLAGAWRLHKRAGKVLVEARAALDESKRIHTEITRINDHSTRLHTDAVRLLAEADQLAADTREAFPPPDDTDDD